MAKQKFIPLSEWKILDNKQKYNMLTRLFFLHSTIPMFENKKLTSAFTRIRNWFKKQESIQSIYAYLYSLDESIKFNTLTELFVNMDKYYNDKRFEPKQDNIEQYKPIDLNEILGM